MQEHLYFVPSNELLFPIIILVYRKDHPKPITHFDTGYQHLLYTFNLWDIALLFCINTITKALQRNRISPKQASALNKEHHTSANWPRKQSSEKEKQQNSCFLDKSFLSTYRCFSRGLAEFFQRCMLFQQFHFIQIQITKQLQSQSQKRATNPN